MPTVHGYIRVEWPTEVEIELLRRKIGSFCAANGYRLGSVFVDRGVSDDVFARIGFIDLLDEVRNTSACAVVVPTVDHLSSDSFVHDALTRMVQQAKATVLVVNGANDGSRSVAGGRDVGSALGESS